MLEWIYRNLNEDSSIQKSKIGPWSRMIYSEEDVDSEGYYTYSFYVKIINSYCFKRNKYSLSKSSRKSINPLNIDLEHRIEMSLILAAEEFIKAFEGKTIVNNQGLEELLDQVKCIVNRE